MFPECERDLAFFSGTAKDAQFEEKRGAAHPEVGQRRRRGTLKCRRYHSNSEVRLDKCQHQRLIPCPDRAARLVAEQGPRQVDSRVIVIFRQADEGLLAQIFW